jgi:hypothetical protein
MFLPRLSSAQQFRYAYFLFNFLATMSHTFIQYTSTLKRVEVAVKKLVNGTKLETINIGAIANPESLPFFVNHPDLRQDEEKPRAKL